VLREPIATLGLRFIGGSDAVQAATRDYWHVRALATPFALANYVILGWLIGLGRAGLGLALQIALNGVNVVLSLVLVVGLGLGVAGVGWASFAAEAGTTLIGAVVIARLTGGADWPRLAHILERAALRMIAVADDQSARFALSSSPSASSAQSARGGGVALAANEISPSPCSPPSSSTASPPPPKQFAGRAIGAPYRPAFERSLRLYRLGLRGGAGGERGSPLPRPVADRDDDDERGGAAAATYLPYAALVPLAGPLAYQMDGVFIGATWSAEMRNMMLVSLVVYIAMGGAGAAPRHAGLWIALLVFVRVRGLTSSGSAAPRSRRRSAGGVSAVRPRRLLHQPDAAIAAFGGADSAAAAMRDGHGPCLAPRPWPGRRLRSDEKPHARRGASRRRHRGRRVGLVRRQRRRPRHRQRVQAIDAYDSAPTSPTSSPACAARWTPGTRRASPAGQGAARVAAAGGRAPA
jgi:MATE family multidrug resistance protein